MDSLRRRHVAQEAPFGFDWGPTTILGTYAVNNDEENPTLERVVELVQGGGRSDRCIAKHLNRGRLLRRGYPWTAAEVRFIRGQVESGQYRIVTS